MKEEKKEGRDTDRDQLKIIPSRFEAFYNCKQIEFFAIFQRICYIASLYNSFKRRGRFSWQRGFRYRSRMHPSFVHFQAY